MLPAAIRYKLHFGPYRTPRFKLGAIIKDEIRGEVTVVGLTDARIPWPIVKYGRFRSYAVFGGLAKAVRLESNVALRYWFGVSKSWVWACRRAFGVPAMNEGTRRLRVSNADTPEFRRSARKAWANASTPERRAKSSASHLGKSHKPSTRRKLRKLNLGERHSAASRHKMSASHKNGRSSLSVWGQPWSEQELDLLRTLTTDEVARRTGRTIVAVRCRKALLTKSKR
jgi:hypothetical protein